MCCRSLFVTSKREHPIRRQRLILCAKYRLLSRIYVDSRLRLIGYTCNKPHLRIGLSTVQQFRLNNSTEFDSTTYLTNPIQQSLARNRSTILVVVILLIYRRYIVQRRWLKTVSAFKILHKYVVTPSTENFQNKANWTIHILRHLVITCIRTDHC